MSTGLVAANASPKNKADQAPIVSSSSGAIVYGGESVARETIDGGQVITPENSRLLSAEEVRNAFSVKDFVLRGSSLKEIQKYYPETTANEVKRIEREASSTPTLMITNPICNNVDFYSIVRAGDNKEYCFANAGTMSFYMPGIYKLCPGNNNGHVWYYSGSLGAYYASPDRGPVWPRDTCFFFSGNVDVWSVTIN
ncbi:beta/gamma crystallin domain-containing protein [Arthrobacter sp. NicSoilB11]|jgi:hypothetical protein|uniref:beta/gamma crystallin domain-containing protein n=1 Tax=Arthrobacter sp. NicSoilB11 TaxID=2830999 RepID=UPI001CC76DB6|nr:beta/gamma crystallin domain-containing protein [Arthrobacter sp. NicSoilB11]